MAAALHSSPAARLRLRFSLAGMFVFIFGISIGLAYWRLTEHTFLNALIAGFGPWLVLGLIQRIRRDLSEFRALPPDLRSGLLLQVALPIGLMTLLAIVVAIEIRRPFDPSFEAYGTKQWALRYLADFLLFLAIIGAYWSPPTTPVSRSLLVEIMRSCSDVALLGLAAWWAATVLPEAAAILGLVHIAIRGVESAQPTRWAGRPFYPANLELAPSDQLFGNLFAALALFVACTIAGAMLLRLWQWKRLRLGLLVVLAPCLIALVALVYRAWSTDLPKLSPFLMIAIREQSFEVKGLCLALILTLGTALAMSFTVTRQDTAGAGLPRSPLLHQHPAFLALCLLAIIGALVFDIWKIMSTQFSPQLWWLTAPRLFWWPLIRSCQQLALESPERMIRLAAILVLTRTLWQRWRNLPDGTHGWQIDPTRFLAAQLISVTTLSLLFPLTIWWGLVAALTTFLS